MRPESSGGRRGGAAAAVAGFPKMPAVLMALTVGAMAIPCGFIKLVNAAAGPPSVGAVGITTGINLSKSIQTMMFLGVLVVLCTAFVQFTIPGADGAEQNEKVLYSGTTFQSVAPLLS